MFFILIFYVEFFVLRCDSNKLSIADELNCCFSFIPVNPRVNFDALE